MPRKRRPPVDLAQGRLLRAALDFCAADKDVQLAPQQWKEVHDWHQDQVCCLPWKDPFEDNAQQLDLLPRSLWCEHCIRITNEAVD